MLAKLSNITLAFGALWMSSTTQLQVIYNLLLANYNRFWIRLTIRPPPELHRFSNALSTLHKVSLLVRQIALSDFCSRGSQVRLSSNHALCVRNDVTDFDILDSSTSHSSPPSLASPPLVTTPARRLKGHPRDIPAKVRATGDSLVPSRVKHLNAESNVQTCITQFQRNASVTAPRALSNPSAKGQPLVLGLSQPPPTEPTTTLDLPNRSHVTSTGN